MAGLWGLVLSQHALLFGLALVVLAAALAAAIIFRKRGLTPSRPNHTDHYITHSDFDRVLEVLRREFGHSFDSAQTAARNAAAIGEKVIAAVRPIESALRDLNNRLVNLEKHANDRLGAEQKPSSEDNGPAVDSLHLERLERQLVEVTDRISSLTQVIEEVRERETDRSLLIEVLDGKLTDIQRKIDSFNLRLDSGENRQADLSNLISPLVESVTALKGSSDEIAQRVAELEQRFVAKTAELEARLGSFPASDHLHALVAAKSGPLAASEGLISKGPDEGDKDQSSGGSEPVSAPPASGTDEDSGLKEPIGANGRGIAPEHRGGGSRGTRETTTRIGTLSEKAPRPKVELIAARGSGDWEIFVEVESVDPSKLRVLQGTNCLLSASHAFEFGPLRDLATPLQILHDDVKVVDKGLISDVAPILYFHLHNEFAREMRGPSRGLTLAVVPDRWEYDEGKSGLPPIESEAMGLPGYRVHFLSADTSTTMAFNRPGETPFEVASSNPRFLLAGHHLPDAEEEMGPLFGGELPRLQADTDGDLAKIHTVVVGAEGRGSGRWRDNCKLNGSASGDWQQKVRMQGSGWYFVRLYDSEDDLIDSLDFRYVKGLMACTRFG